MTGRQVIKCKVAECFHWASGDNCDLTEIWVQKSATAHGGGLSSAAGGAGTLQERDTFCASFDPKH